MKREQVKIKPRRSRLAQSRIDYIVFGNPGPVRNMIYDYGYEPPKSLPNLTRVVRELIRQEGKQVVIDLVKLHPDRDAILGAEKESNVNALEEPEEKKETDKKEPEDTQQSKPEEKKDQGCGCATCAGSQKSEDSYCGCNHASYNDGSALGEDLSPLNTPELLGRYETLSKQAAASPESKPLSDEVTRIWNEIRQRNQSTKKNADADMGFKITKRECVILVIITSMLAGTLIAFAVTHKMMKEMKAVHYS